MKSIEIVPGVHWVGALNPTLRKFDVVMEAPHGTTYNSYLVRGDNKVALVETVKESHFDEHLERLKEIVDITGIDYLVLNHTEPDHSGSVARMLDLIPNLKIVASATAAKFLQGITNRSLDVIKVEDGDTIDLGEVTLRFISAPFLHWPDSMFTFVPEKKVLFTCDAFGAHYSDERLFLDQVDVDYLPDYKYYFDVLMRPFRSYVLEAVGKIEGLDIDCVCPGHGLILRGDWRRYMELYREWASVEDKVPGKKRVAVLYVSAYGYTKALASSIADGVEGAGDFEVELLDLEKLALDEAVQVVRRADAVLIGSPTIMGDALPPVWNLITHLSPIVDAGKMAAAFGSYGWSGEAVPNIEQRLKSLRMKVMPGLRVNFKPSQPDLDKAYMFGNRFARQLIESEKPAETRKWRCLVCGQVFDGPEPPDVCPACGASKENFVRVQEEEIEFTSSTPMEILIVGSGAAAVAAAEAARKRNQVCSITIISEDRHMPYYRPALSDLLCEDLSDEELFIHEPSWYEEQNIKLMLGRRVAAIDVSAKKITLDDGTQMSYDRLILAAGSRPNRLANLPGADKTGVFALRSLDDCLSIKERAKTAKAAVIVGGGVLGLEAAWSLRRLGLDITILENAPRLLPRQLDQKGSEILENAVAEAGIKIVRGASLAEILGDTEVKGVKLSDGQVIDAGMVLFSIGVTPNAELAREAGMNVNRGIIVNDMMKTSADDVYAAGDVAEYEGAVSGLWPQALEQGRIAGANAVGDKQKYKPAIPATYLDAFGLTIVAIGDVGNTPDTVYRTVEVNDPANRTYKKYYFVDGTIKGAVLVGPQVAAAGVINAIEAAQVKKPHGQRWQCLRCGYIHEGPEPPDVCPVCGAPKNMFVSIE